MDLWNRSACCLLVLMACGLGGCSTESRRSDATPGGSLGTAASASGVTQGETSAETGGVETGSSETGDAADAASRCDAFADRCGSSVPWICSEIEEGGLVVPETCNDVAGEYFDCLDSLSCEEAADDESSCLAEFEAAHLECPSAFGFCVQRFGSIDENQADPLSCEFLSGGCIDGQDFVLFCDPVDDEYLCTCFVNDEVAGTFARPSETPPNFCLSWAADQLASEHCAWPTGVIANEPVG